MTNSRFDRRADSDLDDPFDLDQQLSLPDRIAASWDRPAFRWFAGVLAFAVLAAIVIAMRSSPAPIAAVPVVKTSGSPPASALPTASVSPSPSAAFVVVDVTGPVRSPGLFTLPAGSRIADAVAAAGGLRSGRTRLNLARVLQDGEQIDVGADDAAAAPIASGGSSASTSMSDKLDLNTASAAQLEELPRVGPVLASKIIEFREQHSGFRTVDQLREVSGIGEATFAQLAPLVTVS